MDQDDIKTWTDFVSGYTVAGTPVGPTTPKDKTRERYPDPNAAQPKSERIAAQPGSLLPSPLALRPLQTTRKNSQPHIKSQHQIQTQHQIRSDGFAADRGNIVANWLAPSLPLNDIHKIKSNAEGGDDTEGPATAAREVKAFEKAEGYYATEGPSTAARDSCEDKVAEKAEDSNPSDGNATDKKENAHTVEPVTTLESRQGSVPQNAESGKCGGKSTTESQSGTETETVDGKGDVHDEGDVDVGGHDQDAPSATPITMAQIQHHAGPPIIGRPECPSSVSATKSETPAGRTKLVTFIDRAAPHAPCKFYNPYDEMEELEELLASPHIYSEWAGYWLKGLDSNIRAVDLSTPDNEFCDIDTNTRDYMKPIKYPRTEMARPVRSCDHIDENLVWRQHTYTSNYRIRAVRDNLSRKHDLAKSLYRQHNEYHKAGQRQMESGEEYTKYGGPMIKLKENIMLRPASPDDMVAVSHIYNLEVMDGMQATHLDPVKPPYFHYIFKSCEVQQLPFIVAIACDEEVDMKLVPKSQQMLFHEFLRFRAAERKEDGRDVVGFAYMQTFSSGITSAHGNPDQETGQISVQLHFFVHKDHRRKGIGHALFDRMCSFASPMTPRLPGYKWEYSGDSRVYADSAMDSARKIHQIYMSTRYSGPNDGEIKWHEEFFGLHGHFKNSVRLAKAARCRIYGFADIVLWVATAHSNVARNS